MTEREVQGRSVSLPETDAEGYFGLRFESIGGLGAHLAGQLLAEAVVLEQGLNASHFSSYGSEKKGSPVRSFVRICAGEREIRTSSPVERPQVVAVFHEALAGSPGVAAGLGPAGTLVLNTPSSPAAARAELGLVSGTVGVVDALRIAREEGTRVNTAMLGAVVAACPFIDADAVRRTLHAFFARRDARLADANAQTFDRGRRELRCETVAPLAGAVAAPAVRARPAFGYLEAPLGGVILDAANSVARDLTTSRQGVLPALDLERCVHCGLCEVVCPDLCLVWQELDGPGEPAVRLLGVDYHYCKGCLKCTEACPTGALTELREEPGWAEEHRVPLYAAHAPLAAPAGSR